MPFNRGCYPKALAALPLTTVALGLASIAAGSATAASHIEPMGPPIQGAATAVQKGKYTIALSDAYVGNNWRKEMISGWTTEAKLAEKEGYIASYKVDITAENTAAAQIAQIDSLILQHVNAIDIDAASPTALNPVITKACDAGITVVVMDSLASAPCEYNLTNNTAQWGSDLAQIVINGLHGKGNIILAQGIEGSAPNAIAVAAQHKLLAKYPGIHIVATVDGEGSVATTQQAIAAVLPSLGKVNGVIDQTGAAGVFAAFKAAGRPLPVVAYTADGLSLRIWQQQLKADPKYTATGVGSDPGEGSAAFWESVLLLNKATFAGKTTPHMLVWPNLFISDKTLDEWLKVVPASDLCANVWTLPEVKNGILDNIDNKTVPPPPVPNFTV